MHLSWKTIAVAAVLAVEVVVFGFFALFGRSAPAGGLVVSSGAAAIDVAEQTGPWGVLAVRRVVTPVPAWVVVQARRGGSNPAGTVLGYTHVPAGTTPDVNVALDPRRGDMTTFVVTVIADRGGAGVFEFTPGSTSGSAGMMSGGGQASGGGAASAPATPTVDKPLVVGGKTVAVIVSETFRSGAPGVVHRVVNP